MWVPHHHTGPWSVPPSLEGSTPLNEYKERPPERCLQRIGYGSGHRFLSDSDPALIGSVGGRRVNRMEDTINNGSTRHDKPPFRFGRGWVPLGNEFAVVTDRDAYATLEAAWAAGVRYHDVAPLVWSWSGGEKSRQLPAHRILLSRIPAIPTS